MIGQLVGDRYRIRGRLGEGGMASVYTAVDEKLDRLVAIKIMHEKLTEDPDLRQRFLMEAKTLSSFDHPSIIQIFDYSGDVSDTVSRHLWIVMEILQGYNVSQFVAKHPGGILHPLLAAFLIDQICGALAYAHAKGIFHRDVKPENVFILRDGRVKLMDFGIAKDSNRSNITLKGAFMGSPSYMSPEQVKGGHIDARSDIYSVAVMFYEITTGKLPYPGGNPSQVISKILTGKFIAPGDLAPWLPDDFQKIILTGMSHEPQFRYQNANQLRALLKRSFERFNLNDSAAELKAYFSDRRKGDKVLRVLLPVTSPVSKGISVTKISKKQQLKRGPLDHADLRPNQRLQLAKPDDDNDPDRTQKLPVAAYSKSLATTREPTRGPLWSWLTIVGCVALCLASVYFFLNWQSELEGLRLDAIQESQNLSELKAAEKQALLDIKNKKPQNKPEFTTIGQVRAFIGTKPDAEIYVDGKAVGNSRDLAHSGLILTLGPHRIRCVAAGYIPLDKPVLVTRENHRFNWQLQQQPIVLPVKIKANRKPSRIVIVPKGSNPLGGQEIQLEGTSGTFNLRPGDYEFIIFHDNAKVEKSVKLSPHEPMQTITVDFEQ